GHQTGTTGGGADSLISHPDEGETATASRRSRCYQHLAVGNHHMRGEMTQSQQAGRCSSGGCLYAPVEANAVRPSPPPAEPQERQDSREVSSRAQETLRAGDLLLSHSLRSWARRGLV